VGAPKEKKEKKKKNLSWDSESGTSIGGKVEKESGF